jgi:hypothetical protein
MLEGLLESTTLSPLLFFKASSPSGDASTPSVEGEADACWDGDTLGLGTKSLLDFSLLDALGELGMVTSAVAVSLTGEGDALSLALGDGERGVSDGEGSAEGFAVDSEDGVAVTTGEGEVAVAEGVGSIGLGVSSVGVASGEAVGTAVVSTGLGASIVGSGTTTSVVGLGSTVGVAEGATGLSVG